MFVPLSSFKRSTLQVPSFPLHVLQGLGQGELFRPLLQRDSSTSLGGEHPSKMATSGRLGHSHGELFTIQSSALRAKQTATNKAKQTTTAKEVVQKDIHFGLVQNMFKLGEDEPTM